VALAVLLGACGEPAGAPEATATAEPELSLTMEARDVGPRRIDVLIDAVNLGEVDVLVVLSARADAAAGVERTSGPTNRAVPTDDEGKEIASLSREPKSLEWAAERLRSGSALSWSIAVRCLDEHEAVIEAELRSTTVGSVREAHFEPVSTSLSFTCPSPRTQGRSTAR
jgi:hypothetical protein